jgi:hypothetical protein
MTTRRMLLEQNLSKVQEELKDQRALCDRLLGERDDNEAEIKSMVSRNSALKRQLNELSDHLIETQAQRDSLQITVDDFQECQAVHEAALEKIYFLEQQLAEAQNEIVALNKPKENDWLHTMSLSEELSSISYLGRSTSIGATDDVNKLRQCKKIQLNKYIKLRKSTRSKAQFKAIVKITRKYVTLKKESIELRANIAHQRLELESMALNLNSANEQINELSTATAELMQLSQQNRELTEWYLNNQFECETNSGNQTETQLNYEGKLPSAYPSDETTEGNGSLPKVLDGTRTPRANNATSENNRRRRAQARLLRRQQRLSVDSTDTSSPPPPSTSALPVFELPTSTHEDKNNEATVHDSIEKRALPISTPRVSYGGASPQHAPRVPPVSVCAVLQGAAPGCAVAPAPTLPARAPASVKDSSALAPLRKTVLYTDRVGVGLGEVMHGLLNQAVINNCMPGASLRRIGNQIAADSFDEYSTLIVCLGDSSEINKHNLSIFTETLTKIVSSNIKMIVCAFPFSKTLSMKQNNDIYNLNSILYKLTLYHNNVSYFDTNKFINRSFVLTRGNSHLPRKYLVNCAKLLAYNIISMDPVMNSITSAKAELALSFVSAEPDSSAAAVPALN